MLIPYPWQEKNWHDLQSCHAAGRIPHALLLTGAEGIGLEHFSRCLITGLLCKDRDSNGFACNICHACHLVGGAGHPDFLSIQPEKAQIKIIQIKNLIDFINLKSYYGGQKIALISQAESMNKNAANALLKTLEEPPEKSLIILLSHRPSLLPITIKSRCQSVNFKPAFDEATARWVSEHISSHGETPQYLLAVAGGAPLAIEALLNAKALQHQLSLLNDLLALQNLSLEPVGVAKKWKSHEIQQVLTWLLQLFSEIVRIKCGVSLLIMGDPSVTERLQKIAEALTLQQLVNFYILLFNNYALSTASVIVYNAQGLLEDIVIFWQQINNKV